MLCRVLFVAAVVSYVLCVLLLSGVQKEELDAGTLRKLQRHNVNIDDIGDRKLRSQCLTEKLASTPSIRRVNVNDAKTTTAKTNVFELDTQNVSSQSHWRKLFAYLKEKEQNSSNLKKTTIQSIVVPSESTTETMPSMRSRLIENLIGMVTETPGNIASNDDKEKSGYIKHYSANIQPESGTSTIKDNIIAKQSSDVDYISKIVAEVLSQRQSKQVQTTTALPMRTFNDNILIQNIDKVLEENKKMEASHRVNYGLNTTETEKHENNPIEAMDNKEQKEIMEDVLELLSNRDIQSVNKLRRSFLNDVQTELEDGKITLHNARDKLSDMLSQTKNDPNNWLYVVDSRGIRPITSEPSTSPRDAAVQLTERDKAIICKSNNEMHLIQKEIYRYICPYDHGSEHTGGMVGQKNNMDFDSPSDKVKIGHPKYVNENNYQPNDNKSVRPYYFEHQNNAKDQKLEIEQNTLDVKPRIERYEPVKENEFNNDDKYKSKWPNYHERLQTLRNVEQQDLNRGNLNLLSNRQNNRLIVNGGTNEAEKSKLNLLNSPLTLANQAEDGNINNYKPEWAFNLHNPKEFEHKFENNQENPTFLHPNTEEIRNPNYPGFNAEFKNTWPYYFNDIKTTQNPNSVDKKALYQIPRDPEMLLDINQRVTLDKESLVNNRLDKMEKISNNRNIDDPQSFNWYGMKVNENTRNGYIGKYEQKEPIHDEVIYSEHNMSPNINEKIIRPYFIETQKSENDFITTEEIKKEPQYVSNSKNVKPIDYNLARNLISTNFYNKLMMNAKARSSLQKEIIPNDSPKIEVKKEDDEKINSLSPEVLKQIANTVKEIVLRDLKIEAPVTSATETTTTTTITTTRTTITSSTTTVLPISVQIPPELKTITKTSSSAEKDDTMKIQKASQALNKFMEMFEKINQMKNAVELAPNVTQALPKNTQTPKAIVIATMPTFVRNPYAPYKFYAPLLPPVSPYNGGSPYIQTKAVVLDPYLQKIIQAPTVHHVVDNGRSVGRSPHALTFQTNSNEIKPLKVPVSKAMIVDNIVVTTRPPRDRGRHLREYSDETYRNRNPHRQSRNELRVNRSRGYFKFEDRSKARNVKMGHSYDRYDKPRSNYEGVRFHEKLEKEDSRPSRSMERKCGSKEACDERIASRQQRPLISIASTYDDTHFRNFLKTQKKVNDMLERILATKTRNNRRSSEVI